VRDDYLGLVQEERLPELTVWLPPSLLRPHNAPRARARARAPVAWQGRSMQRKGRGGPLPAAVVHRERARLQGGAGEGEGRVLRVLIEFRVERPRGGGVRPGLAVHVHQRRAAARALLVPLPRHPRARSTFEVCVRVPPGARGRVGEMVARRTLPGAPRGSTTQGRPSERPPPTDSQRRPRCTLGGPP